MQPQIPMMMSSIRAFRKSLSPWILGLLACGMAAAAGQPPDKDAEHNAPGFKISSWGEWKGPDLFVKQASHWKKIDLLDLGYTESLPFRRDEPVVLARLTQTDKGQDSYLPFLSVPIAANCKEPLILLVADDKGGARAMVVDLNPKEFPWGSYKFVNFTQSPLVGLVNESLFRLEPGKTSMIDPKKEANARLAIQVKTDKGDASEMIYSNMVINRPSKRMILFFHPQANGSGQPRIESRCLVDFRQE